MYLQLNLMRQDVNMGLCVSGLMDTKKIPFIHHRTLESSSEDRLTNFKFVYLVSVSLNSGVVGAENCELRNLVPSSGRGRSPSLPLMSVHTDL